MRSSSERGQQEEHRPWTETLRKGQHVLKKKSKQKQRQMTFTSSSSTLTSSLTTEPFCIQPTCLLTDPKGEQSWVLTGRTDAEAETPILWPPYAKSWLIGNDPNTGRDWGQEEKGTTEDEMAGWHHWHNGHEFRWTPGVSDGQGGLACCGSWGCKESDTTEQLDWTDLFQSQIFWILKTSTINFTSVERWPVSDNNLSFA